MMVIKFDNVAYFDVDDTLIMYQIPDHRLAEAFEISIPDRPLFTATVIPNYDHIERLKLHKTWGNGVVVWSRSGYEWAEQVIKELKLENYVDLIVTKPSYYYDDKPCCKILGEHRYITPL